MSPDKPELRSHLLPLPAHRHRDHRTPARDLSVRLCILGNRETGAIVGAASGGAIGGVIGNQTGSTTRGAIIERVGEGIQVTFASGLLFDFDSDAIRPDAGANLRTLAESLTTYPDTELLIVGYTDSTGSDTYNFDLSNRRANAAWRFLTAQGVASDRMHASGRGEWEPLATNETKAGRQANRRIEVAIFAGEALRTTR